MNSVETDANGAADPLQAMNKVLEEYPDGGEEFEELIAPVEKHLRNEIRKRNARILFKVSCSTALALVTIFAIVTYTPVYSHLRAISRIGLIKVILNYIILIIIISKLNTIRTCLGKRR
jgi:amino acid transporter